MKYLLKLLFVIFFLPVGVFFRFIWTPLFIIRLLRECNWKDERRAFLAWILE